MNERTNEHGVRVSDLNLFTYKCIVYIFPTEKRSEETNRTPTTYRNYLEDSWDFREVLRGGNQYTKSIYEYGIFLFIEIWFNSIFCFGKVVNCVTYFVFFFFEGKKCELWFNLCGCENWKRIEFVRNKLLRK